jgi:hypothetical protein
MIIFLTQMITDYNKKTNWNIKSVCNRITNASTPTTPLSQFVPFAALSQAQIAPIATRPVLRVKRMLVRPFGQENEI